MQTILFENFSRYTQNTRIKIDDLTVFRRKNDAGMQLKKHSQLTVLKSVGGDEYSLAKLRDDFAK